MRGRKMVITLGCRNIMKQAHQFLTNKVFMVKGKTLYGMEEDRVCEDGGVE
jgi:hypothetical protein